jgi:hypothetical protein
MPGVVKQGNFFVTQYVTGPQFLRLMLDLQPERIPDPFVTATQVCAIYGRPEDAVVRDAVLRGNDEANAEFGTRWHPLEIRYFYSTHHHASRLGAMP